MQKNIMLACSLSAAAVHVPLQWMQDPEILRMTESEPLTLEEEYEMVGTVAASA